ncbi:sensor histidine kinase [Microbispora sp. NPDC049125]|uniref:sensor histidine kinase n=1 Tax=Microbispora sp. NPDC049125 TaxID=3154929 RepID=UPI003466FC39
MPRDLPLRRSLLVRLLAVSVLVSVCSVAATAWLAVRGTTVAIQQEEGQALADDARVYNALLGWAATHADWSGAQETVNALARQVGHRITLTTEDRVPVLGSDAGRLSLPAKPTAVIEPLSVNTVLAGGSPSDRIDPRAVGPFQLPRKERTLLRAAAQRRATCLRESFGIQARVADGPSGRPYVDTPRLDPILAERCASPVLDSLTATEGRALGQLNTLVNTCLKHRGAPPVKLGLDFSWAPEPAPLASPPSRTTAADRNPVTNVSSCIAGSRREQLAPYVAPSVLLFVSSRGGGASTIFDLSPASQARIAGVTALVLVITVTATVLSGAQLVRPLRTLTGAARRMEEGDVSARVTVARRDEIGALATAFNAMSRRREQLEELRKAMVSDVAHELRTPLSNIRGWLEATEDGVVTPDRALVASLLEEAALLQHVIDDLQDLAMADAGELTLRKEHVNVPDLLAQVATAHRGGADAAGVSLSTRAEASPGVLADPVRLRQAVGNLVSNAVRHTPAGGGVSVLARRDGDELVIDVADTGVGIAADDLPLVFERFWRVEKSRSRRTGGSGLGLPIVRKLAEAHGGSVSAASVPGKGSVFTLRLPIHG